MDKIRLIGIDFYGHHGLMEEERELGGRFIVDVEVGLDLKRAGSTDSIDHTADYRRIYELVKEVITGRNFKLIEAIAHSVAETVMKELKVEYVKVRVRKPNPPVNGLLEYAEVEVERGEPI